MTYGLNQETIQKIHQVFEHYSQIEQVYLYGSRAKGTHKPGSDIDLCLEGLDLNLQVINKIGLELDDLLLPYTFDLSIFHQIQNSDLIDHVKRVGIVFFSKL